LVYFILDLVGSLELGAILAYYDVEPLHDEKGQIIGQRIKSSRGYPGYDPRMMTALLLYGYVTGVTSSRLIEKKCVEDVGFRVLSGNQKPDHDTIATFRRVHLEALKGLFMQVLELCEEAGLVKLGHVALDGTKVKANASKHKAMSYGRMKEKEEELQRQIEDLLRRAEETDQAEDQKYGKGKRGDELPEELARRETRLQKIQKAKAALEARAKAQAQEKKRQEQEEQERRKQEGESEKGGPKAEISEVPKDKAQENFTDPESRIMKNSDKAFIQGYNAQAAVDHEHQVIVACEVTNQAADAPHLKPMVQAIRTNTGAVPRELSADAGYFSEENVKLLEDLQIDPLVAAERLKHAEKPPAPRGRIPKHATVKDRMRRKLRTLAGRAAYALRKVTVEPVFGQTRTRGLIRFWLRGLTKVKAEWALWCMGHNVLKLFRSLAGA
jgi:transposase